MSFLFSAPKPPRYVPPPPVPTTPSGAEQEEMEKARRRARLGAKGRRPTLLTGGEGVTETPTILTKSLLGA